jgi:hypothetical protein
MYLSAFKKSAQKVNLKDYTKDNFRIIFYTFGHLKRRFFSIKKLNDLYEEFILSKN